MKQPRPDIRINRDDGWSVIEIDLESGHESAINIRFGVGEIAGYPDPTLGELRNITLSWAAREILAQLPEGYNEGKPPYAPGPRKSP